MVVISKADVVCEAIKHDTLGKHEELEELKKKVRWLAEL